MLSDIARQAKAARPEGWWRSAVVYQIYPRSFSDSNGDGIGDLPGITARLDYLHDLGVDVLWLSPIYRSPQVDNGYDISDYQDIDPIFGTLADLDALIAQAHARGMKIVMDLVVNHTSDQHPWFQESRAPQSPKRNWYYWRPAKPGCTPGTPGAEPDNSEAAFAPSSWTYDPASGEYYLGMFSPAQPDLNWEEPTLRHAIYEMMRWWVNRGIDGFRMDVINLISKPHALTSGGPLPDLTADFAAIANGPRLDEFLAEMNREVGLSEHRLLTVGEMPCVTVEVARSITDPAHQELNMVFSFEHVTLDQSSASKWDLAELSLPVLKKNLSHWQEALADSGWNSLFFDNHDQPRAVSRFGDDSPRYRTNSAKTLATVLHLHKGTPYIYQGEELGMTNATFSDISQYQDLESINYHTQALRRGLAEDEVMHSLAVKSRDHARTPMHWDNSDHAGFTTAEPWFAVNSNYGEINAAAQAGDPTSVLHFFKSLIDLRHQNVIVQQGRFELLHPEDQQLWIFTRTLERRQVLVVANCSSSSAVIPDDVAALLDKARILLSTHQGSNERLNPWESRVVELTLN